MTYTLLVKFERDFADDANAIGNPEPTPKELAIQLALELQEAYDDLAIAGHFQVQSVQVNGESFVFDRTGEFVKEQR